MRLYPLIIIIACSLYDPARTLQIFNGTLMEITCSAAVPVFRLVDHEREYDSRDYNQLPDLFDIDAIPSPNRDNITLVINGTERSNNLTMTCRNEDAFAGQFQTLFTFILQFVSILPAPNNVQYSEDPAGYLQIFWEPPKLVSDKLGSQDVRIDSRITHFLIYISNGSTTTVYNALGTSFAIGTDEISCSFWFQVAAVNPAGVGEYSPPQTNLFDWCMASTHSSMVVETIPWPASSGLSAGGISAIIIVAALITVASATLAVIIIKLKNDRHGNVIQNLKSELSGEKSDPNDTPVTSRDEKEKDMEAGHSNSGNDGNEDERHASTQRGRSYSQEGPPAGLYYAEINVIAKRKNQIPAIEDASRHEYAVLEKPNQITESDTDQDGNDNPY